ncbi:MAG: outer membrane lipoprotein carrier protein LolA [Hyphomicrobiales bacterium]|nr:outer membrane lipoprotein carrier protein LolA [Hyphomicrobiales bacterium]
MPGANAAITPFRRLGQTRLIALAAVVCLTIGNDAVRAGAPVDPIPQPQARPDYAPRTASATKRPAAAPATVIRRAPSRGDSLSNINSYFNSFRTMEGDFIQIGPQGQQSEGKFYLERPGKIRFDYSPPVRFDVISDGRNVAVRNGRTATQDYFPLKKTPLRYLLADHIDLTSGVVNEIREQSDLVELIIIEDSRLVKGRLTLIFDRNTYELRQWIVTDGRGLNTSVAVYNTTTGKRPDPSLFKINYYE